MNQNHHFPTLKTQEEIDRETILKLSNNNPFKVFWYGLKIGFQTGYREEFK